MTRQSNYPIESNLLNRWSPRAMSGESLTTEKLMTLLEAARWAPSSANHQPWRFIYETRESAEWQNFLNLLADGNKAWCIHAAVLILVASQLNFDNGDPDRDASLATGMAIENLLLQTHASALVGHVMAGFDHETAAKLIALPEAYRLEAMIAIGIPGPLENIPEYQRSREVPSERKALETIISKGKFNF